MINQMLFIASIIFSSIFFPFTNSFSNDNRYMSANPITRFLFKGKEYGKEKLDSIKQSFQQSLKKITSNNRAHIPNSNSSKRRISSLFAQNSNYSYTSGYENSPKLALPPSDKIDMSFNQSILFPDIDEEVEFGLPGVSLNGIFRRKDMEKSLVEMEESLQDLKDWLDVAKENFTKEDSSLFDGQNHTKHQTTVSKRHFKFLGDAVQDYELHKRNNNNHNQG